MCLPRSNNIPVAAVLAILGTMLESSDPKISAHAKTLVGARQRGSTTKVGLDALPADGVFELVEHPNVTGDAKAYKIYAPNLSGRLGVLPLKEVLAKGVPVKQVEGAHGPELVVEPGIGGHYAAAHDIFLIMGPAEGDSFTSFHDGIIYTWHPGEPLLPLDKGLSDQTAVKLN